jgi:hypothetical protein
VGARTVEEAAAGVDEAADAGGGKLNSSSTSTNTRKRQHSNLCSSNKGTYLDEDRSDFVAVVVAAALTQHPTARD